MQVYEYFISHHMAKAFESLFGSVTCLPGCFTLYRLRTPDTHKPLFISNHLIHDYQENRVDTLHMKNLLHLGEDRYLTTLLLKHFPTYKTQFARDAHAFTVAPDDWKVLLSQRRRWINSTVHNLGELAFLDQLCGFCCFSMRFVVMIDLVSTIIQPITVGYVCLPEARISLPTNRTTDRVPDLSRCWSTQAHSDCLPHPHRCGVWFASLCLRAPSQMGYDRMDGVLYPCYSRLLVPFAVVLLLEDGRLFMGRYPCRFG